MVSAGACKEGGEGRRKTVVYLARDRLVQFVNCRLSECHTALRVKGIWLLVKL
jgi:hypothetical protein